MQSVAKLYFVADCIIKYKIENVAKLHFVFYILMLCKEEIRMRLIKNISVKLLAALVIHTLVFALLPTGFAAGATTYYVSATDGKVGNPGTSSAPFRTITEAIEAMCDGDICVIRDGVYHESLTIKGKNNLTFRAATNGNVTISGGVEVSDWTPDTTMANVWKTNTAAFVDANDNDRSIVYQNDALCYEARWPNMTDASNNRHPLLLRENYARVDSGSTTTPMIVDSDLSTDNSIAGKDLSDASVWCASGHAYWSYIIPIESFSGNTLNLEETYTYTNSSGITQTGNVMEGTGFWPGTNRAQDGKNIYYIFDSKELLDVNGEWYRDRSTGTLYFYDDSGSAPRGVELRAREYAINIDNASGISVEGINVRGAMVQLGDSATNCVIKNAEIETVDYFMPRDGEVSAKGKQPGAQGITVGGTNNLLTGCEIFNMYGEGVLLEGNENRVINNYIHDINFEHTYSDGVYITGNNHLVSHNTIEGLGRGAVGGLFANCEIAYNDMSDGGRLSRDGGIIYFVNNDHGNTEFHHNILHDSVDNEGMQYGLYLDSFTTGVIVYRNLLYNLEANDGYARRSIDINPNSLGNIFFNNTVANTNPIGGLTPGDRSQTVFVNNLFKSDYLQSGWTDIKDEHTVVSSDSWTNTQNGDYTLLSTASSVIDKGVPVPEVADTYVGAAPDCGAFEYGETPWTAGHDFSNEEYYKEMLNLNTKLPYRNFVVNGGFESYKSKTINGSVSNYVDGGWTDSNGADIPLITERAWTTFGTYAMSGNYSAKLTEGQSITQTITGLKPYTTYLAGGYAQVMGEKTEAWNGQIPSGYPTLTRGTTISGFTTDEVHCIRYSSIKFGSAGYDALQFRLQFTASSNKTTSATRSIEVWLGDPKNGGEKLSTVSVLRSDIPSHSHVWVLKTAQLSRNLTGTQDIYVLFKGDFYGIAVGGGVFFDDTEGTDMVTLTAQSDSGDIDSLSFSERNFSTSLRGVEVTTGAEGSIILTLSKTGGSLNGYVDEIRVAEAYNPIDVYIGKTEVKDENGKKVYIIHKDDTHIVSGKLVSSGKAGTVTATLRGIDDEGTVYQGTSGEYAISAGGAEEFSLTAKAPLSDNAKFLLSLTNESGQTFSYEITDEDVSKQADGESTLLLKDYAVRNIEGTLLEKPVHGTLNIFEVSMENKSTDNIPMRGILSVYKDGVLSDLMYITRNIDSNESDRFWVGTQLPEDGNIVVKLFVWESTDTPRPLFESALFEVDN